MGNLCTTGERWEAVRPTHISETTVNIVVYSNVGNWPVHNLSKSVHRSSSSLPLLKLHYDVRMPRAPTLAARRLLALRLLAGLLSSSTWSFEARAFPDLYEACAWAKEQLAPLAAHDPALRDLLRVLDEEPPSPWSSQRGVKRELRRLAADAQAIAVRSKTLRRVKRTRHG